MLRASEEVPIASSNSAETMGKEVLDFLNKTECHFTWGTSDLDLNLAKSMVERMRDKIDENDETSDSPEHRKWPLKLTYGYELVTESMNNFQEALEIVRKAIQELVSAKDYINTKYQQSFLHIALSCQAFILLKKEHDETQIKELVTKIKPFEDMSKEEKSGVLAMKAQILRYYGPAGTSKGFPLLREAVKYNPDEPEWKLSLVVSLNRQRHVMKGSPITWSKVEEPINLMEDLLNYPGLTLDQRVQCKYYLAVAYHDFEMGNYRNPEMEDCRAEILRLVNDIYEHTEHPQILSFCAETFSRSKQANDKNKGLDIINSVLHKFPDHVGMNMTACKLYKSRKDYHLAARYAENAFEGGAYGGAWLFLECKVALRAEFDEEEFFEKLETLFPEMYLKQTHLRAFLYYIHCKQDIVKAAQHILKSLNEDPNNECLQKTFCYFSKKQVRPIEIAYNKICRALRTNHPRDDYEALRNAKVKIEQCADVKSFANDRKQYQGSWRREAGYSSYH